MLLWDNFFEAAQEKTSLAKRDAANQRCQLGAQGSCDTWRQWQLQQLPAKCAAAVAAAICFHTSLCPPLPTPQVSTQGCCPSHPNLVTLWLQILNPNRLNGSSLEFRALYCQAVLIVQCYCYISLFCGTTSSPI